MNFIQLKNRAMLGLRKHCPTIFVVVGVGGMIVGGVKACIDTHRKFDATVQKSSERIEKAREIKDEKERSHELTKAYICAGVDMTRLYAPSVIIGGLSATAVFAGNILLVKRNLALAAAYTAIDTGFKKYRERVVDRFGQETDTELRTGAEHKKIEVTEKAEDGTETKVEKDVLVVDKPNVSGYARIFAKGYSESASANHEYNFFFLKQQQELANHMLRAYGYLFLNDVCHDLLGFDESRAGQTVGWVYDKHSEEHGDNYIDFGIREISILDNETGEYEPAYLLDFNVDGSILNHAQEKGLITE